jgi:hypothetical protein
MKREETGTREEGSVVCVLRLKVHYESNSYLFSFFFIVSLSIDPDCSLYAYINIKYIHPMRNEGLPSKLKYKDWRITLFIYVIWFFFFPLYFLSYEISKFNLSNLIIYSLMLCSINILKREGSKRMEKKHQKKIIQNEFICFIF